LTGWIVPVTDRTKPHVRICAACERCDPHMSGIEDRDAGVHAAPWDHWRRTEIDACEHPDHARTRDD